MGRQWSSTVSASLTSATTTGSTARATPDQPRYNGGDKDNGQNPNLALTADCAIDAEGSAGLDESQYGGANDFDNSGILNNVIVKHTGATVGNGDELNGISFGGVGSGTTINNLAGVLHLRRWRRVLRRLGQRQRTSSRSTLAMTASTSTKATTVSSPNALVIQQQDDGNHCIESDGIGSYSSYDDTNPKRRCTQRRDHCRWLQQPPGHQRADLRHLCQPAGHARSGRRLPLPRRHLARRQQLGRHRLLRR